MIKSLAPNQSPVYDKEAQVVKGYPVTYSISKSGYQTVTRTTSEITGNKTISVILDPA